jgi:DNA invertase Pin-like site-specific DNA recombinase
MLAGTRGYSSAFVFRIRDVQFGVDPAVRALGQACLEHEVPITMVAKMFGVTRATVYNWLTGETAPRGPHYALIPEVIKKLRKLK